MCMFAGERYISGIGQVEPFDEVRREIIHQLSIRPMAHSELVKALPENVRHLSVCLYLSLLSPDLLLPTVGYICLPFRGTRRQVWRKSSTVWLHLSESDALTIISPPK